MSSAPWRLFLHLWCETGAAHALCAEIRAKSGGWLGVWCPVYFLLPAVPPRGLRSFRRRVLEAALLPWELGPAVLFPIRVLARRSGWSMTRASRARSVLSGPITPMIDVVSAAPSGTAPSFAGGFPAVVMLDAIRSQVHPRARGVAAVVSSSSSGLTGSSPRARGRLRDLLTDTLLVRFIPARAGPPPHHGQYLVTG